jgi:hypothetical protein
MQIEYCESCRSKLSDAEFNSGQAIWINNEPYCKECGEKVKATAPATKSGPKVGSRSGLQRATPSGTRLAARGSRRTPAKPSARRSGLNRTAGDPAKASGGHTRRKSGGITRPVPAATEGPSMVMVSVIGAVIGVLLAVIAIVVFFN